MNTNTRGVGGINSYSYDVLFRSPIESDRINDAFSDIVDDLGEAWNRADHINSLISDVRSDMSYQLQQLSRNMAAASGLLLATSDHYDTATGGLLYWNAYDEGRYTVGATGRASRHDPVVGEVTLPWGSSWTKIPLHTNEYGEYVADSNISIEIDVGGGLAAVSKPHDAYDMVDNNPETAWVVTYPVATAPANITAVVTLPDLFTTYFNSIVVHPFPVGGARVTSLQYYENGAPIDVPGFLSSEYSRRYHFRKIDSPGGTRIKLVIEGTTLYDSNNNLVKVFGIRDLDVALIEYESSSTFRVRLDSKEPINTVTDVIVNYDYDNVSGSGYQVNPPLSVKLTTDAEGTGTEVYNSQDNALPFTGAKNAGGGSVLWAHFTLNKVWGRTAVVRDITVRYR